MEHVRGKIANKTLSNSLYTQLGIQIDMMYDHYMLNDIRDVLDPQTRMKFLWTEYKFDQKPYQLYRFKLAYLTVYNKMFQKYFK